MIDHACPECVAEFGCVWHVTVGTGLKKYPPVFAGPVVVDIGRCESDNLTFERVDGGRGSARAAGRASAVRPGGLGPLDRARRTGPAKTGGR